MKKLFEGFRKFLTESEEDATLGKLLQLNPEHAASFIDSLKDVYPDIERRYVEALGVKRERLRKEGRKQDIIIARLSDENKKINSEWDRLSNEEGFAAGRKLVAWSTSLHPPLRRCVAFLQGIRTERAMLRKRLLVSSQCIPHRAGSKAHQRETPAPTW